MGQSGPCLEHQLPAAPRRDRLGRRGGADPGAASVDLAAHVGPGDLADLAGLGHDRGLAPGTRGYSESPRAAAPAAAQRPARRCVPVSRDPRPSRRSQAERRAETRRTLIDAGRALFTEQGFHDVTTSAIVERAAVTRGALYYHFPEGKDALFEAVFEVVEAEIDAAVLTAAQTTLHNTGDITEAFMAGTDRFLQESARPEIQRLLLTDGPAALGWGRWYELDARHGMAQITLGFEGLIAAG